MSVNLKEIQHKIRTLEQYYNNTKNGIGFQRSLATVCVCVRERARGSVSTALATCKTVNRYCITNNFLSLRQIRSFECGEFEHRTIHSEFNSPFGYAIAAPILNNGTRCIIIRFRLLIKCYCWSVAGRFLFPLPLLPVYCCTCNQARDHTIFLHKRQFIIFSKQ